MEEQQGTRVGETSQLPNPIAAIDAVAPTGWRMKLAKAAAQLIAGSEKGAIAYGHMRERIDTIEGRTIVSKALANAVAQKVVQDPEIVDRAQSRFLGTAIQQQINLEAVVVGAGQHLPLLPAPAGTPETEAGLSGNENNQSDPAPIENVRDSDEPLDRDWAATFTGIAENATSEELRGRLSRILAGELSSPGTYSRATVRAIAELEKGDLEAVQRVLPYVLGNHLMRTRADEAMPSVDMLLPLTEAGLISDANAMLSRGWPAAPEEGMNVILPGVEWGLLISAKAGHAVGFPVVPLTRTGIAVIDLLGRPDERVVLRNVAADLPTSWHSKILLGKRVSETVLQAPFEQLYPKPKDSVVPPLSGASPFKNVTM